jgi:hypothetical protein
VTAANVHIEGTWRLLAVETWRDGRLHNPYHNGRNPKGLIHYMPEQRMSVLIANDGRRKMSGDRYHSPLEELAESAATFTAYAGPYSRDGAKLIHHLEVSSYENDAGTDYVRYIEVDGDHIWLVSPPVMRDGHEHVVRLKWERVAP